MRRISEIIITWCAAILFISCESERSETPVTGEPKVVEIAVAQLESELSETRALGPINELSYNEVYIAYGETPAGGYVPDPTYTKTLKGLITYGITVFQPLLFYPDKNGIYNNIYLKGFYPREGVTDFHVNDAAREINNNRIHYNIDGRHDIMISSGVKGNYTNSLQEQYENGDPETSEAARLRFQHLLSRISFTAKRSSSWSPTLKLMGIWITNVSNSATLDLSKEYTDSNVLVFDTPRDKEFKVYENNEGLTLNTATSSVLGEAMIESGSEFQVKVKISSGEILTVAEIKTSGSNSHTINIIGDDIPSSTVHDIIQRGYHYKVILNFENLTITTKIEIGGWNDYIVENETGWW